MQVLHVVESFNGQAIESWLLRLVGAAREKYTDISWTFLCLQGIDGVYADKIRLLGGVVVVCKYSLSSPIRHIKYLRKIMSEGDFDIIHFHQDVMSAIPLLASLGLPARRVIHVHNTELGIPTGSSFKAALLRPIFRFICLRSCHIVGVSKDALLAMLAKTKLSSARHSVIHCGIDVSSFACQANEINTFKKSLGLSPASIVILFVGRMIEFKNPLFVLSVLRELTQSNPNFVAIFAGVGPLEEVIRQLAVNSGLSKRVLVLGWRDDIPKLMHASDLLIWPGQETYKEGLGLGIVEAQASGLPVLMSFNVPEEAIVVPELVWVRPLSVGASKWAETIETILTSCNFPKELALHKVKNSSFSISSSLDSLVRLYLSLK